MRGCLPHQVNTEMKCKFLTYKGRCTTCDSDECNIDDITIDETLDATVVTSPE